MSRFFKNPAGKAVGASPGTLVAAVEKLDQKVKMTLFDYDAINLRETEIKAIEEVYGFKEKPTATWLDIAGLHDPEILTKLGQHFEIHPLVLEDILNTNQRPKIENYDSYLYLVFKMLNFNRNEKKISGEQVSIILGPHHVISFKEDEDDIFDVIRQRIRNNDSRIRRHGSDYLAYRLLDTVIDHYFVILEEVGQTIEDIEEELLEKPSDGTMQQIHQLRRELIYLRKSVWPLREVIANLEKEESGLIKKTTHPFLRDVYDHTIQVIDTTESFRDMASGLLDLYLSTVSNRMNEVMKILTIMASIFIPLTFLAGIYGMNFKFMPELDWQWGYPSFWILIVVLGVTMVVYFKKKGWL